MVVGRLRLPIKKKVNLSEADYVKLREGKCWVGCFFLLDLKLKLDGLVGLENRSLVSVVALTTTSHWHERCTND